MIRRVTFVISVALFTLLSVTALVIVDVRDESFPIALHAQGNVHVDLSASTLTDSDALEDLRQLNGSASLGLFKLAPDLTQSTGQVFVCVDPCKLMTPSKIDRFSGATQAQLLNDSSLQNSYTAGDYLITSSSARYSELNQWGTDHRVKLSYVSNNFATTLRLVASQSAFALAIAAIVAVLLGLVTFWFATLARGRSLRLLNGVPVMRIHFEDIGAFNLIIVLAFITAGTLSSLFIAVTRGLQFLPQYVHDLATVGVLSLVVTSILALVVSTVARPQPFTAARTVAGLVGLSRASEVLKFLVFAVTILAVGPTVAGVESAQAHARQLAQWERLADYVTLNFNGAMGESGFQQIAPRVGQLVADRDAAGAAALSYVLDPNLLGLEEVPASWDAIAIVNKRWLSVMAPGVNLHLVTLDGVDAPVRSGLQGLLSMQSRDHNAADITVESLDSDIGVGLALGGNGDLLFAHHPLLIVVTKLSDMTDSFLGSATTSKNLVFQGLGSTELAVKQQGLTKQLAVKYAAQNGILTARFAAYFAWLRVVALVGLITALAALAIASATTSATLSARRSFPLRLSGNSWWSILSRRLAWESAIAAALVTLAVAVSPSGSRLITALIGLGVSTVLAGSHLIASRWVFGKVVRRVL